MTMEFPSRKSQVGKGIVPVSRGTGTCGASPLVAVILAGEGSDAGIA